MVIHRRPSIMGGGVVWSLHCTVKGIAVVRDTL